MSMEFLAATKEGIVIYDALTVEKNGEAAPNWRKGHGTDGTSLKVVASLPSPPNAFGHIWSPDGERLASVCDEGVRIYDATKGYKTVLELAKVAPDVGGRAGGVRNVRFSPNRNWIVTYEKWDPQFPENVHVWVIEGDRAGERLYSCTLKGYTSGALPVEIIKWTPDEAKAIELLPGTGLLVKNPDFSEGEIKIIPEKHAANFQLSCLTAKGTYACCYTPESPTGAVARTTIYNVGEPDKKATFDMYLPAKVKDCNMSWNFDGSALLLLANSDVDETGSSYFGTTYLYWVKPESKVPTAVYGSKDGQVQDFAWSPVANEFMAIVGFQPAVIAMHDGKTGKRTAELGKSRRNTVKWNPFGKTVAVGGFGTLAGDLDFYDRTKDETIVSLRAPLTVDCAFGPDGRHFLSSTLAPRMNEGNQITMYKYTGEQLFHMAFVPDNIEGRHEDTGAGARTKTQALLYASSWRPMGRSGKFESRPVSPPPDGAKRKKGLSEQVDKVAAPLAAWRPRGVDASGGSSVAAMMRGELPAATDRWGDDKPSGPNIAPMEEWEIKKLQRQAQKDAALKEQQEKDAVVQARKDMVKAERSDIKTLKTLKEQLEQLNALKEKDWDELTEEDEEKLEGEVDLRNQIAELEKKVGSQI